MDYSLRELECFIAVAEELSFTRAALRLHMAQPPLSRHIRALEEKLGARLFERSKRAVKLTAAGGLFFEETRGILPQLLRAGEMTRRSAQGELSRLRIGFVSAVLSPELIETFRRFRAGHPEIQVILQDLPPAEQLQAIRRGTLDGGFVGLEPGERVPAVRYQAWSREPLACFVPSGHRLARASAVALSDLAGEPMLAVSSEGAPAFSAHVHALCRKAGFRPRIGGGIRHRAAARLAGALRGRRCGGGALGEVADDHARLRPPAGPAAAGAPAVPRHPAAGWGVGTRQGNTQHRRLSRTQIAGRRWSTTSGRAFRPVSSVCVVATMESTTRSASVCLRCRALGCDSIAKREFLGEPEQARRREGRHPKSCSLQSPRYAPTSHPSRSARTSNLTSAIPSPCPTGLFPLKRYSPAIARCCERELITPTTGPGSMRPGFVRI